MADVLCTVCLIRSAVHHMIYNTALLMKGNTFTGEYFGFSFCADCWKKIEKFTREIK